MSPDRRKLRQKLLYIRNSLAKLREIRDQGEDAFGSNPLAEPAATRLLQVAIEAVLDASHHIVAREGWGLPQSYRAALDQMIEHEVLPAESSERFRAMVAFRNRAVHLYDDLDMGQVFSILRDDLDDFELFLEAVTRRYLLDDENAV